MEINVGAGTPNYCVKRQLVLLCSAMASSEGTSWIQQIFSGVDKLTDILNVGRLLFYTAAGSMVVIPAEAVFRAVRAGAGGRPIAELVNQIGTPFATPCVILSTVVGFIIAGLGFAAVIDPLNDVTKRKASEAPISDRSYPFRYPQLRNHKDEDYSAWLIQEYFRFVEIVVYIPLGLLLGLGLTTAYIGIYMLTWALSGRASSFGCIHRDFLVAALLSSFYAFFVWPRLWLPRVVGPMVQAYHRAKLALIDGVDHWKIAPSENPQK
jgi:hypothetical protein